MRMKITVPNSLSEIKLSQYQKFLQIQKDNEDEHFLASKIIEIFCGIPHKESYSLKAKDVHRITNILADMFEQKPQLKRRFVLNGVEYGFIPNLDDMTLGEYVDLDTYISKWEEVEKAMAVLYRPIVNTYKDKYNIEEYKAEGSEVFKDVPMDIVVDFVKTHIQDLKGMSNSESKDEFEEFRSVNYDYIDEDLKAHFKRFK